MVNRRWGFCAASIAIVVAVTTGCSDGGDEAAAARPEVDLASLDYGNISPEPRVYGKPKDIEMARLVEAMRLGNHVPLPWEIDPAFEYSSSWWSAVRIFNSFDTAALTTRTASGPELNTRVPGLVGGFVSSGADGTDLDIMRSLDNVVMIFDTETHAKDAATALADTNRQVQPGQTAISLAEHPEAIVQYNPDSPGLVTSYYPTGKYVVLTSVVDLVAAKLKKVDPAPLLPLVSASLTTVPDALRGFTPTPPDQLMNLDVDPDGMLGRALHTVSLDMGQAGIPGRYNRHGGLHLSLMPQADRDLFEETGVDQVSWQGNFVYRTEGPAAARALATAHAQTSKFLRRAPSPANLPDAQCLEYIGPAQQIPKFACSIHYDRFAADVSAGQLTDVHQRVSAQYAILVKSL